MSFSYSKEEMTVTLNYDQFNKKWEAYTNIPKYRDKMIRAGWTLDKEGKVDGKVVDWFFSIDFDNMLPLILDTAIQFYLRGWVQARSDKYLYRKEYYDESNNYNRQTD